MAITIVGTPQMGTASNGGDPTLTFDGTPQEDDVVVLIGGHSKRDPMGPITTGYTTVEAVGGGHDGSAAETRAGIWTKRLGATPDASVECEGDGHPQAGVVYGCFVLRGVDETTIIDVATIIVGPETTGNYDAGSITTSTDGAWVIAAACGAGGHGSPGTLTGYSNNIVGSATDTTSYQVALATKEIATAGAEDPPAWASGVTVDWFAFTIAIRPAGAGGATVNGTGLGAFTFTGAASGTPDVQGQGAATLTFTGAASGTTQATVTGVGSGSYAFTGTASGVPETSGTAQASLSLTGTASGAPDVQGSGSASVTLTAAASGNPDVQGQASTAFTFTGAASGQVEGAVSGTGSGDYTFSGTASGTPDVHGTAIGAFSFSGTGTGTRTRLGQAVATLTFTAAALGAPVLFGQAVGTYTFTGAASGIIPGNFPDLNPIKLSFREPSRHLTHAEAAHVTRRESRHVTYQEG